MLVLALIAGSFVEIPYKIRARGVIMPVEEWGLYQGTGGSLVQMQENHLSGVVSQYNVSEFQRGDIASYRFNEDLLQSGSVKKGDTIAWVYTSDIHLDLIALQGDLAYQRSLLEVYIAGEKPEEMAVAENRVELAQQELKNQQMQTARIVELFEQGVVSRQEYELSVNELKIREYALEIAQSVYQAMQSGRKREDIEVIRSRIASMETQIAQLQSHMGAFHLVAPISGQVIRERNPSLQGGSEVILRVADFSSYVVYLPVDYYEEPYVETGQTVSFRSASGLLGSNGKVVSVDNNIRLINNRPKIFLGVEVAQPENGKILRNMVVDAHVICDTIRLWEYLGRLSRNVYQN